MEEEAIMYRNQYDNEWFKKEVLQLQDIRTVTEAAGHLINYYLQNGWQLLSVVPNEGVPGFCALVGTTKELTFEELQEIEQTFVNHMCANMKQDYAE